MIYRASIIAYAIVNIAQSVAVMVYGVNLVPTITSVSHGFLSFVARLAMLGLVIAELSFFVALLERGYRRLRPRSATRRFLVVTTGISLAWVLIGLIKLLILLPYVQSPELGIDFAFQPRELLYLWLNAAAAAAALSRGICVQAERPLAGATTVGPAPAAAPRSRRG